MLQSFETHKQNKQRQALNKARDIRLQEQRRASEILKGAAVIDSAIVDKFINDHPEYIIPGSYKGA